MMAVERPFGEENRRQLIDEYFREAAVVTAGTAWLHVYKLLLWIDPTTGLAHCYESDKAQPGRPWYARSLVFHDWISEKLDTPPAETHTRIDWLFQRASRDLAARLTEELGRRAERVAEQRAPYEARGFPRPESDPDLSRLVRDHLREYWAASPSEERLDALTQAIRRHFAHENKRKNLVGEGFEDVLAATIERLPGRRDTVRVETRPLLHDLPGFQSPRPNEKAKRVDLAIVDGPDRRILVTAKWSVRADREEQFASDFEAYARLENAGRNFDYVLVTNEFDAARLVAACERRQQNAFLFSSVVHVNPEGLRHVHRPPSSPSARKLFEHIASGRLQGLDQWVGKELGG